MADDNPGYTIAPLSGGFVNDVEKLAAGTWGSIKIAVNRELFDLRELPCYVAINDEQKVIGYCHYRFLSDECEIMALESVCTGIGVGSKLIEAVTMLASERKCARVYVRTSNDNTHAIRFYQRRGFSMCAVGWNYLDYARELKPEIPMIGDNGIPLLHEIEFEMSLSN